jgi:D-alanyl-D-alanine carboxypeptidase
MTDGFVGRVRRDPARVWAPHELVAEALRRPALFAPGAPGRWAYANTNYILLGMIIERVTGNSLERELDQRIIQPLGLSRTALSGPSADPGDIARGYVGRKDYSALNMSFAWAAGGLVASAADVGRFAGALFGGELLRPETLALMRGFGPTAGGLGVADLSYGLGLMQRALPADGPPAPARLAQGHTGALAGYRSAMWHLPQSGITVVALVNRYESDPNRVVRRAIEALFAHGALGGN